MRNREAAVAAGALLLWLLTRRQDNAQELSAGAPGITFPPVVPIGGGQVQQPEQSGSVVSWLMDGVEYVKNIASPRGIRNKNPLNIVYTSANQWVGQTGSDGRYATFTDAKYGVRAAGKILDSYARQGYKTIRQIIERWAPDFENNTASYLEHVIAQTGWGAAYVPSRADYPRLLAAMIKHENGTNPYSLPDLAAWLMLP